MTCGTAAAVLLLLDEVLFEEARVEGLPINSLPCARSGGGSVTAEVCG